MKNKILQVFSPEISPDLEHAPLIREEALDWLETHYANRHSFTTADVLRMAAETDRRWLISRLRQQKIGDEAEFSLPDTADALTILFLRSKGVKFRDAVDAVTGKKATNRELEPRYGGIWNRLIISALDGIRRRVPARLLGSAVFALLRDPKDHYNCLVIVKRNANKNVKIDIDKATSAVTVSHDYVYHTVLERPAPSCSVIVPSREVMFFTGDQLPARSEVTSRHFISLQLRTEVDSYELLLGTMKQTACETDRMTLKLASRILDIVYHHFETFIRNQISSKLTTPVEPGQASAGDLQLWLITRFLTEIYPGSLCEISETPASTQINRVLASSITKPWEPMPWEPAKRFEMLSGYASQIDVPLIVKKVEYPWTAVIDGVEMELRYLNSKTEAKDGFSAMALPISISAGNSSGALYLVSPRLAPENIRTEVQILNIFSRIIGETIERHDAAVHSADVTANVVSQVVLKREQFKDALLDLLNRAAIKLRATDVMGRDVRLPFLLVSAYSSETDQFEPAFLNQLKNWLIETLQHMEWRSFVRSREPGGRSDWGEEGFMGDVPGIGIMIALGNLVSKDELDKIRNAFPTVFNRTYPTNSPVKLVSWVLDVPAQRIIDAAKKRKLAVLADEIENWSFDVATLVDDLAQSSALRDSGEWEAALKRVQQALRKPGSQNNSYLRRLGVDCSLGLADWPSALKYAREAVALSSRELGSGLVRSLCMEADVNICLCNPVRSWDLYSEAVSKSPHHPLPRYYRGQALLLIARLLRVGQDEQSAITDNDGLRKKLNEYIDVLVNGAVEDLTSVTDLLDNWGLIPESYQYRNFHLVPTLLGQALGYLLTRSPGPAASRLLRARRSFPKDELFFREFLFAKCWEQGIHRQYAALFSGDGWKPLEDRLHKEFGKLDQL